MSEYANEADLGAFLESDGPARIKRLFEERKPVWVRRTSGAWQECRLVQGDPKRAAVLVEWTDAETGKNKVKHVASRDLLQWQEEHTKES